MKKFWAAVAIIAAGTVLFFIFKSKNPPPQIPQGPSEAVSGSGSNVSALPRTFPGTPATSTPPVANVSSTTDLALRAASPNPVLPQGIAGTNASELPSLPPMTVLDNARVVMHNYRTTFGENPIGTNPEITAALMGKNPKEINFVSPESGLHVNERGEMVDGYGTPFFFHQISGKEMEIHSAGPDKVMWTFDDVVTR